MNLFRILIGLIKKKAFAAILCQCSSAILTFAFIWSVAKVLPASEAGIFLYTYSMMMILVQLSRVGTDSSMIIRLSSEVKRNSLFLVTVKMAIYVALIAVVLSAVFILISRSGFMDVYKTEMASKTVLNMSGVTVIFAICQVLSSYFQSRVEIYSQYWSLAIGVSFAGCMVSLVYYLADLEPDASAFSFYLLLGMASNLVVCIILFFVSINANNQTGSQPKTNGENSILGLAKHTMPFAFLALLNISIQWGGQILAGVWLSDTDLATLSVVVRISTLVSFIYMAFDSILATRISQQYNSGDMEQVHDSSVSLVSISSMYSLVLLVVFVFFGEIILGFFGGSYIDGYVSLLILAFGWFLRVVLGPTSTILLMTDNVRVIRRNLCFSSVLSVFSAVILIPLVGLNGAATSTAVGVIFLYLMNYYSVKKKFGISYVSVYSLRMQLRFIKGCTDKVLIRLLSRSI